jgi:PAS domain S-box-containing protein
MPNHSRSENDFEHGKSGTHARDRAEAAIEKLRQRGGFFVDAVRATRMPMALTDPTLPGNPIVFANQAFLDLSGYGMREILGQQPYFMNGLDTDPGDAEQFRRFLEEDRDGVVETVQYGKDGRRFVATVLLSAFKDEAGNTLNHFLSWADVTRRVDAETDLAELRAAQAALRDSEKKYRTLFETMGQGYCELELIRDAEGRAIDQRYLEFNPAFERLFGIPVARARGRRASEIFPDLEPIWTETYERVARTRQPQRLEHPLGAHGRWFEVLAYPGQGDRVMVLYEEVTERKRAETELRESESRLSAAFESVPAGIAVMDTEGRTIIANATSRRFLPTGIIPSRDSERGDLWKAWKPGGLPLPPEEWPGARALRGERVIPGQEMLFTDDDGRAVWTNVATAPTFDDRGKVTGIVTVISDIDERKRSTEALKQSEERQSFLLSFSDALRAEADADAIARRAIELLIDQMKLDRCFIVSYLLQENRGEVTHQAGNERVPPMPEDFRLSDYPDALRVVFGETLVIEDESLRRGLSEAERQNSGRLGMRALIGASVRKGDGGPLWSMVAGSASPRRWTRGEIALVEEVTERTWAAMERARGEAALRVSEERYRQLFERIDEGFCIIEVLFEGDLAVDYRFVEVNPAFERHTGIPDARGRRMREIAPDHEQHWFDLFGEIALTGRPRRAEGRARALGDRWHDLNAFRVGDPSQRRVAIVFSDITQRHRDAAALRESEARLRQFGEASQDVLWIRDAHTLQWTYLTPAFETIYGLSREEALTGNNYRSWVDLILPEDRERATENIRRVLQGGHATFDYRIRRPRDGQIRWVRNTDFPITDERGNVALLGGIGHDLTELRETELRLKMLVQGIPQLVWRAVDGGHWTWASPQWEEFTGMSLDASLGWGWLEALHSDDRPRARTAWTHAGESGGFEVEYRIARAEDRNYRWFQTRATPLRDDAGRIVEWLGTSTDIHELRELQERQRILVAELQHRTRNLMGVVRSTAERTGETSADFRDFRHRFRDRLETLARVQGLLSRLGEHDRVSFDELLRNELTAMHGTDRVTLDGPAGIKLRSSMVQTLAMALHELATNAVKYGALGQPEARLSVTWRMLPPDRKGRPKLHIEWRESGVTMPPPGAAPQGGGQGRELIEEALPYQLGGQTRFELGPDGVRCSITIPVSETNTLQAAYG